MHTHLDLTGTRACAPGARAARILSLRVAVLAAVLSLAAALPVPAAALSSPSSAPKKICGLDHRAVQPSWDHVKVISRPNSFGTAHQFCVMAASGRPGFRILTSLPLTGPVQAYPFTGVGCAYSLCSPGTDLPRRVSNLSPQTTSSWTWWGPADGYWNAAYDIWFDTRDQITAQDNGAELMIWLRTMPGYAPRGQRIVWVGGHPFWFLHWRAVNTACQAGRCQARSWNYVQFRFLSTTHSVRQLRLMPFIRFAIGQRLIGPSWWLTSIHAGYELWSGGRGLATTWFNART
jgi:Glycosyl hydrolase family 12